MAEFLITNARILHESGVIERGWLHALDGKIVRFDEGLAPQIGLEELDAGGYTLLAGFIDVHVHGAMGADTMDGNIEGLRTMSRFFASTGVTAFTPTTLTSPHEETLAALYTIKDAMREKPVGAAIVGAHLEGPYLNKAKAGAQNPEFVRLCRAEEAQQYLDTGVLRVVSLAPEFPENHWLIAECVARGISASVAHTNATYAQALHGIDLGIHHATHTYNAMTGLHHREPGTLGAVLGDNRVRCELVADGVHVHEGAMKILWKVKGRNHTLLITDAMRATGLGNGNYTLGGLDVIVRDGKASLKDGTLAGSVLAMNQGVRNFMAATGESLETLWPCFSLNAAAAIGLADSKGSIAVGKDCDLVLVDEQINVLLTVVGGEVVYSDMG
jgi:N-acetylglucosamine-6-phosphate deacetylase